MKNDDTRESYGGSVRLQRLLNKTFLGLFHIKKKKPSILRNTNKNKNYIYSTAEKRVMGLTHPVYWTTLHGYKAGLKFHLWKFASMICTRVQSMERSIWLTRLKSRQYHFLVYTLGNQLNLTVTQFSYISKKCVVVYTSRDCCIN